MSSSYNANDASKYVSARTLTGCIVGRGVIIEVSYVTVEWFITHQPNRKHAVYTHKSMVAPTKAAFGNSLLR